MRLQPIYFVLLCLIPLTGKVSAQDDVLSPPSFLVHSDTFSKKRFWMSAGTGAALYTGFSIGLWNAWYKDSELGKFHVFNDWNEWQQVDKFGHLYTAYNYTRWAYQGARWTGMPRRRAAWASAGVSTLLQSTIEVMDGFAVKWGYSWGDVAFNTAGTGLFVAQELAWQEQRITMKVSSNPQTYPDIQLMGVGHNGQISLDNRLTELYGSSYAERFIKDYNAQVNWFSFNLKSFAPKTKLPPWLNIAVGYGAGNMVAGEGYDWTGKDGLDYHINPDILPRYRQIFLSTDIELSKLPIKNKLLRTLIYGIHHFKFPGPALEYNTQGKLKMHWLFW